METIEVKFDATQLPKWAQENISVVRLCKQSLEYRLNVLRVGKSHKEKVHLMKQAENIFKNNID